MIQTKLRNTDVSGSSDPDTALEIAMIKKDISIIKDNHLHHIEKDVNEIKKNVDRIDSRLWWFAGIIIAATVGPLLAGMFV
jgi:hypothetical protein